jgi:hypothetical protein
MRKLSRKETAKINGGIGVNQCYYTDENGVRKLGCKIQPWQDANGEWIYPLPGHECQSCFDL